MRELTINGWRIEADEEATRRWYESAEDWGCDCGDCRNFMEQAGSGLPEEAVDLMHTLGIDPKKAGYLCELDREDGDHLYEALYPVAGRILETGDEEGEIAFCTPADRPEPDGAAGFPEPRIELDLCCWLPWALSESQSGPHSIVLESEVEGTGDFADVLYEVIPAALKAEGVGLPCEINVLFTDDEGIHAINREQRNVDRATDVLSFPMFDFKPGEPPTAEDEDLLDPGSDLLPLGDMVFSLDRIRAQAAEFGHSERRELAYLAVHSALHLLGYDHVDEGPMKAQMRAREEAILSSLGITRDE